MECGEGGSNASSSTSGFSTLLRLRTSPPPFLPPTFAMRKRKRGRTKRGCERSSMLHLSLWSSRQPVAWVSNLPHFTSVLHPSLLRKAANRIRWSWHSSALALLRASVICLRCSCSVFAVHAPGSSSASLVAAKAGTSRHL